MKLTVITTNLKEGLEKISYAITTSGTLPILSYVLLRAKKSGLEIISTNLEIGIKSQIRAKIDKPGEVVVPFRTLYDFIANNPDEKINLEKKGEGVEIKTNHFKASLLGANTEEFPLLPQLEEYDEIKVKKEDFIQGAQKVIIAPAVDETRPVLSGVLFRFVNKELILAGTDSFRLAEQKIKQDKKISKEIKLILPAKVVQVALRILTKSISSDFVIRFSENQLEFLIDDNSIVGRLIEGEYPDYEQIIPKSYECRLYLNKEEFEKTLKILTPFSQQGNKEVKFDVSKKVVLEARSTQIGSNKAQLEAKIEGKPLKVNFNASFLLDGLGVIEEEEVVFDLTGEISPGILKGKKDQSFTYLVMPLKEE